MITFRKEVEVLPTMMISILLCHGDSFIKPVFVSKMPPGGGGGVKSRMCPPYPQRVVKDD